MRNLSLSPPAALLGALFLWLNVAAAQTSKPPVEEALKLKPIQPGIEYDQPESGAVAQCTLEAFQEGKVTGWVVRDGKNQTLRRFLDTNADNKVDQWCYYKSGIEVYRDIDTNHNRKVDQYRWLGTAGTRWGIDQDEDQRIDSWKTISPEEVSEEAANALSAHDPARFSLLILKPEELSALGLGEDQTKELQQKLAATTDGLEKLVRSQEIVPGDARWVNFGGTRPGIVPAGTEGAQRDLYVYENVAAVVESGGQHNQIVLGTLVRVGDVWRLIDLPRSITEAQASTAPEGFFFQAVLRRVASDVPAAEGLSTQVQQLLGELEQIDKDLLEAETVEAMAPLNAHRADILEKLASEATTEEDRIMWYKQVADTVSAATQSGGYPEGIQRLATLYQQLESAKATPQVLAYVKYRQMLADYILNMQNPDADFAKIQDKWMADLEQFIKDYPTVSDTPEAMKQLAMALEFAGREDGAVEWYGRIVSEFPDSTQVEKARGAKRRIESIGQPLMLAGKDATGTAVDVQSYRGKVVLVHYWASNNPYCLPGIAVLKEMQAKYGRDGFVLVGVNVDSDRAAFESYVKDNPLPWPQLHEPGGLDDSPLANAYGVLVLPTMILADKDGKIVNRNLVAETVDTELRRLLR